MQKIKAFQIDTVDGKIQSGFKLLTLDDLSAGDVLIKAVYSTINFKDALAATGKAKILRQYPLVGGIDVAGYVEQSADPMIKQGDAVTVCGAGLSETRDGGYAEYVRVPSDCVTVIPEGLSLFETMAIGTAGFTAALAIKQMLLNRQTVELGPIVVSGATGGVGSLAIDILSGLGFDTVAITGKSEQEAYLHSLGATQVLHRDRLEMDTQPLNKAIWAGAVDTVGGELLSWLSRSVKAGGNIAVIGLAGGIKLHITVMPFILRGINLLGINSVYCPLELRIQVWESLAKELKPAHLGKIVTHVIDFQQLPDMFAAYMRQQVVGRTVVKIDV